MKPWLSLSRTCPGSAIVHLLSAMGSLGALSACSSTPTSPPETPKPIDQAPAQWQAPLPHSGQLTELSHWWQQFDDPVLVHLIDAAKAASPTVASAASRIEQSRATRVAAGAALLPSLDATASAVRGRQDFV